MAEALNRLGFRLRKVVKAQPQKKIAETDAIFANTERCWGILELHWNGTKFKKSPKPPC
jgi:hypothetical protein